MARRSRADLAQDVVDALVHLMQEPSAQAYRDAAKKIVALRQAYKHKGMPDWTGRSPEYRDLIQRLYQQAGVPPDSKANIQSTIRYHAGNIVDDLAPPDDVAVLGLIPGGPLQRYNLRRRTQTKLRSVQTVPEDMSARDLVILALESVKTIRKMDDLGNDGIKVSLQKLVSETVGALSDLP